MALPFQSRPAQVVSSSENGTLVEFRAGRMKLDGRRVAPDTTKGLIRVAKTDDGLVHFQWVDRTTQAVEEDQIVFPDEAVFEKVTQTSGRVYLLKFKHDDRKLFFWMQEPSAEKDDALCAQVNRELNATDWMSDMIAEEPPEDDENEATGIGPSGSDEAVAGTPAARETGAVPAAAPPASSATPVIGQPAALGQAGVQLSDLQTILSGLGQLSVPPDYAAQSREAGLSLAEVMKPEAILPVLQQPGVQERLAPYLPEDLRTPLAIRELIQSPQFHQQLELFSHLLQSGQVDWSQFGIDPSKYGLGVAAFLTAIDEQGRAESGAAVAPSEAVEGRQPGGSSRGGAAEMAARPLAGGQSTEGTGQESESKKQKTEQEKDSMEEGQ